MRLPSPLKHADFRWFFSGQLVSLFGSAMVPVALAFAVLDASGSTSDLGVVLASRMIPLLAFLLIGGAVADRFSRRTVLVAANLGAGLTQGAVAAVLLTGHYSLGAVAGLEFLNGVLAAFSTPALRGVVPQLVAPDQLRQANSLLGSARNGTRILGPSVSGVLVVTAGSGAAVAIDAVTFLVAAGLLHAPTACDGGAGPPRGGAVHGHPRRLACVSQHPLGLDRHDLVLPDEPGADR